MEKNAYQPRKYKRKLYDQAIDAIPLRPGKVLERVFNPEITEIMNKLDKADDTIRKVIEDVGPDKLLKNIKSNVYKREYLIAISDLSEFHDAMKVINDTLVDFDKEYQEKVHTKFLFEGLKGNDKARKRLEDLEKKFARTIADLEMKKEAGNFLTDFWGRHISERGRALKAWETRFPGKVKALQTGMSDIISKSEDLTNLLSECLDEMSTFRRKRNIEEYEQQSIKIRVAYNKYNQDFRTFYNGYAKPLIAQLKAFEAKQGLQSGVSNQGDGSITDSSGLPATVEFAKPSEKVQDVVAPQTVTEDKPKTVAKKYFDNNGLKHRLNGPAIEYPNGGIWFFHGKEIGRTSTANPNNDKLIESLKQKLQELESAKIKKEVKESAKEEQKQEFPLQSMEIGSQASFNNFINELEVFADEDQSFLISRIAKYATEIQHKSPETALKLINIIDNLGE